MKLSSKFSLVKNTSTARGRFVEVCFNSIRALWWSVFYLGKYNFLNFYFQMC